MAVSAPRSKSAPTRLEPADVVTFGAFQFAGHVPVGKIADFYGLPVPHAEKGAWTLRTSRRPGRCLTRSVKEATQGTTGSR